MPPHERAVCNRLRQFRLKTGLSQVEFAIGAGINPRAYAGYEYARSQLNYPAAQLILEFYWMLNPVWLVDGIGEMIEARRFDFPTTQKLGVGQRALFSGVFRERLLNDFLQSRKLRITGPALPVKLFVSNDSALGRMNSKEQFAGLLTDWLAELPQGKVRPFMDDLLLRAARLLGRYPRDRDRASVAARKSEMLKIEHSRRFPPEAEIFGKGMLDNPSGPGDPTRVQIEIRNLKELVAYLKKVTASRGAKAALAREFGVTRQAVNQWLSGESAPSADIAIRLQHWKPKPAK